MTTKTITIKKEGTITLPKAWLKEINQTDKLKAYFINGNIILSKIENEKVCTLFDQKLGKTITEAKKNKYAWLDKNLNKAIKEVRQEKVIGLFNSIKELKKSLEK